MLSRDEIGAVGDDPGTRPARARCMVNAGDVGEGGGTEEESTVSDPVGSSNVVGSVAVMCLLRAGAFGQALGPHGVEHRRQRRLGRGPRHIVGQLLRAPVGEEARRRERLVRSLAADVTEGDTVIAVNTAGGTCAAVPLSRLDGSVAVIVSAPGQEAFRQPWDPRRWTPRPASPGSRTTSPRRSGSACSRRGGGLSP